MKCSELIEVLEQLAPPKLACDWDNVGLLAGSRQQEIQKIWLALDATDSVVKQAVQEGAQMLLTHHPLIFSPLKKVNDEDFISRRIYELIRQNISYYVMHTNFDAAPGCMADLAAKRLELMHTRVLEPMGEWQGTIYGIGKVGQLHTHCQINQLAQQVKQAFGLPFVTVYAGEEQKPISLVALSPGSGGDMIKPAIETGAQVLITGDIGHHKGLDAVANGLAVIDAGHYGLEHIFVDFMEGFLKEKLGDQVEIGRHPTVFPTIVI